MHTYVKADWSVSDSLSGIDGTPNAITASRSFIDTGLVGKHSFTVSARDLAGNISTSIVNYYVIYNFKFLSPTAIEKNRFWFTPFIPIEFQLKDAFGRFILYTNPKVRVMETDTPLFRIINPFSREYIYILPLRSLLINKFNFITLEISLDDGTIHTQIIKLK